MRLLVTPPLHSQLRRLRWAIPLTIIVGAVLHWVALPALVPALPPAWTAGLEWLVYGSFVGVVGWGGLSLAADHFARQAASEARLRAAYTELLTNHQRLLGVYNLGQQAHAALTEQAALELAAQAPLRLVDAKASTIVTFDDQTDRLKLDVAWGLSAGYIDALRAHIDAGVDATRCRTCAERGGVSQADCPLFAGLQPLAQAEGIASAICSPIVYQRERVGAVMAYFPTPDIPTEGQRRLLAAFQDSVAPLFAQRHGRPAPLTVPADVGGTPDADGLDRFAGQALDTLAGGWDAQAAALLLYDSAQRVWTCRAWRGAGGARPPDAQADLAQRLAEQARQTSAPVVASLPLTPAHSFQSAAAVPLVAEGQFLGALFLGAHRPRAFRPESRPVLTTVAHQVALALRNAQLYDELRQLAVVEERYRLAREVHDGLAQTLAFLSLQTDRLGTLLAKGRVDAAAAELDALRAAIRDAYADTREAIDGLRLTVTEPADIGVYVTQFARQSGLRVAFAVEPDSLAVPPDTLAQLLRITQEALTNVRKHAQASAVEVRLRGQGDTLELTISDDGQGFPVDARADGVFQHHGLSTMRERARSLGGSLSIVTAPRQGARIIITLPRREGP